MDANALFGLSALMGVVAFVTVATLYVWPKVRTLPRERALAVLVAPHMFRFIGLSFLVPGVVSPSLSAQFAVPVAYGDLTAAVLAVVGTVALSKRAPWALFVIWPFNLWGPVDLLRAISLGQFGAHVSAGDLGAAFYIPTVVVPALLTLHFMIFRLLLSRRSATDSSDVRPGRAHALDPS